MNGFPNTAQADGQGFRCGRRDTAIVGFRMVVNGWRFRLCIICECTCLNISDRLLCASIQLRVNPNKKYRCCDYEDGDTIDKPLCTFSHAAIPPTYEVGRNLHMQQIPADPPDGFVEEYHLCMASRQGT